MRAAVLREPGRPLLIEEVQLAPPRPGEIRVQVEAAGVCHTDYHYMRGEMTAPLPAVLGHEGAGIVEEVGADVDDLTIGDRVAFLWRPRCGRCEYCLTGNPVLCVLGRVQAQTGGLPDGTSRLSESSGDDTEVIHHFLGVSCFAEQVVMSRQSVVKVPEGVPAAIAAIAGCAVITGVGSVLHATHGTAGRAMLIIGAGGVGLSAIMGARLVGADPIVVVDVDEQKFALARRLGATHVIDGRGDVRAALNDIGLVEGVPWVIECVGRPDTLETGFAVLAPGGTLVAVGLGSVDSAFRIPVNELVQRQKHVVGSLYGSSNPLVDLPRIFELYLSGRLPLDLLLGERLPLIDINLAYERLAAGSIGRGVIVPGPIEGATA